MGRDEQIGAALKLLRPGAYERYRAEQFLVNALDAIAMDASQAQFERDVLSKPARDSLEAYRAALVRVRAVHQDLPAGMRQKLELLATLHALPEPPIMPDYDELIAICDQALGQSVLLTRDDFAKYSAAVWASTVMRQLGRQCPVTRRGVYPRLAAILHGKPDADLYHHCLIASQSWDDPSG